MHLQDSCRRRFWRGKSAVIAQRMAKSPFGTQIRVQYVQKHKNRHNTSQNRILSNFTFPLGEKSSKNENFKRMV